MKIIVLDLETTVKTLGDKKDNSPFNSENRCVMAEWRIIEDGVIGPRNTAVWFHNEKPQPDGREALQRDLDSASLGVAHNAKFDFIWLLEMGFTIPETLWCTMIAEFVFARAQFIPLSLQETSIRRGVTEKKANLVDEMFKSGIGFEAMPLDVVLEYAEADVLSCAEIYLQQLEDLVKPENRTLEPVIKLMCENLNFLIEIERNGIKIDLDVLESVKAEFSKERDIIYKRLTEIAQSVLGDTPFNLNSGPDQTMLVYSRRVTNRDLHKQIFRIGVGPTGKSLSPPRMKSYEFSAAVRATTEVCRRTVVEVCPLCNGGGLQFRFTKKGDPYKKQPRCPSCIGAGAIYIPTKQIAGLKLSPTNPMDASINGFKVDKTTLKKLITQAKLKGNAIAVEFLTKTSRLNALNVYLTSFVEGIFRWTREDGILHANFNQTVAKTGRLSSSNPNFQNQPSGSKFPVKKAVVSRFKDGILIEADFVGVEFRIAGELSKDPQIIDDILSGKDVHKQTASIINQCDISEVDKPMRQAAKAYTFAPLYGGMGANEEPHIQRYFKEYFTIYKGLSAWHKELMDGVLRDGIVRTPSGREFYFPNARRLGNGRITNATQVVNFPVQSHATGDIVPLACIRALRFFRKHNLTSKLILTVHDSIIVDCCPGEIDKVKQGLTWAMKDIAEEIEQRFRYVPIIPLDIDIEGGKNWMDKEKLS
jgi:DNA polymerase I-like protein with 3'-5' exonuclease and polymerase domains